MRATRGRGFTLIEVLVALVIMAMMSVMAWRAVSALSTTRDATEAHMDSAETINTLVRQWELDLREVQDSKQVNALTFDGATLRLTRRCAGGMQMVAWQVKDGRLTRWASPATTTISGLQDAWFRSQQLAGQEISGSPGVGGVLGWQVYFFRNTAWSNAQSSGDQDDGVTKTVPSGVRMKVQFGGGDGYNGELVREVIVPAGGTR
ncbi:prepilin-type N-terminal cleavage/methylation domain-containing protein [Roseateles sp. YR242]|uniref:prepilin-type N-terminal cleavage/methylation domain-containing protein n=1 Tax=Roseateles sp. YR242 TaxID=1855305 RepID=UPI0015A5DE48|nr:prepilin-type N-terminal cleavage/methylation domain-containing protein [Roseateles sp. YR242]